jgi:hypothetical protein
MGGHSFRKRQMAADHHCYMRSIGRLLLHSLDPDQSIAGGAWRRLEKILELPVAGRII